MTESRCMAPVRNPTDAPWDSAFPMYRMCDEPAENDAVMHVMVPSEDERIAPDSVAVAHMAVCPAHRGKVGLRITETTAPSPLQENEA